ncbi:MAG: hypothetical protein ABIJ09_18920 [Pseudomonadota bacterium]
MQETQKWMRALQARPCVAGVLHAGVAGLLIALGGCPEQVPSDQQCTSDEACPTGYRCVARVCVQPRDASQAPVDAGTGDGVVLDVGTRPDAMPDAAQDANLPDTIQLDTTVRDQQSAADSVAPGPDSSTGDAVRADLATGDLGPADQGLTDMSVVVDSMAEVDSRMDGEAGIAEAGCATRELELSPAADTQLCQGAGATITYGASPIFNLGVCRPALRFTVDASSAQALRQGRVTRLRLVLYRVQNHTDCAGACPAATGWAFFYPMRNDWVEGTGLAGQGANWFQRDQGAPWGDDGASADGTDQDRAHGVSALVNASDSVLQVDLPPEGFAASPWLGDVPNQSSAQLSVLATPDTGLVFVMASKEMGVAPPTLTVTYCQ